jgi:hypothetical protein
VLSDRAAAILRTIAQGRATISSSCEPDLFVDGLPCCDQQTVRGLARAGLLTRTEHADAIAPVRLTALGAAALAAHRRG